MITVRRESSVTWTKLLLSIHRCKLNGINSKEETRLFLLSPTFLPSFLPRGNLIFSLQSQPPTLTHGLKVICSCFSCKLRACQINCQEFVEATRCVLSDFELFEQVSREGIIARGDPIIFHYIHTGNSPSSVAFVRLILRIIEIIDPTDFQGLVSGLSARLPKSKSLLYVHLVVLSSNNSRRRRSSCATCRAATTLSFRFTSGLSLYCFCCRLPGTM